MSSTSLTVHAVGLIFVYSAYGYLQERIIKGVYGPNDEHFTSSALLILFNRLFSIVIGIGIIFLKSRGSPTYVNGVPSPSSFAARIRPASPIFAYAAVAVFNFLSTTCQYEALKYVSYTTQSLAKCAKMIPVLVVGALVWRKTYMMREWVAGGVILAGCGTYLFSQPPRASSHAPVGGVDGSFASGLAGTLFLVGYLFFDGLVSTTQERVFGKNPKASDPFGPESPVLDQMIWTNVFASAIAVGTALLSNVSGTLWPNLELLLTTPALLWDIILLSAASAIGLIILLNTISCFGALTSSLIMTTRQFLSILLNAGIFGNFGLVGLQGWTGVGWVASGIYIKMNRSYDPPKAPKGGLLEKDGSGDALHSDELEGLAGSRRNGLDNLRDQPSKAKQYAYQYLFPIAVPVIVVALCAPLLLGAASQLELASVVPDPASNSLLDSLTPVDYEHPLPPLLDLDTDLDTSLAVENDLEAMVENEIDSETAVREDLLPESLELVRPPVGIQGGRWDEELHAAVNPDCSHDLTTTTYDGDTRTGFVSFPRSGNSYLRSLVERSTGFQTSSIYCDRGLQQTFLGECDHKTQFFVKASPSGVLEVEQLADDLLEQTHFPALPKVIPGGSDDYYKRFDQTLHLIRNPLDSIASWWHLSNSPRTPEGFQNHEAKVDIGKFGAKQRLELLDLAERWTRHAIYWQQAPVLTHTLRYEDLKAAPIPQMMSLLSFLLPETDLPTLKDLACMVETDHSHEAYKSRRNSDFASWDSWEEDLRFEVLSLTKRPFCSFGYDRLLLNKMGVVPEMVDFCSEVGYRAKQRLSDEADK